MWKNLENLAYVTIFLKKDYYECLQEFCIDFEGILWNSWRILKKLIKLWEIFKILLIYFDEILDQFWRDKVEFRLKFSQTFY